MATNNATSLEAQKRGYGQADSVFRPQGSVTSAVSWGAVLAGAAAAASLSLILVILGIGLGLSAVSPWLREGISASNFGVSTIVWLILTQLFASAMGGYLSGRLRTKWTDTQTDEIYFRDTAHGFLAWAVASLATAALLTSAIGSVLSAGASVVGGSVNTAAMAVAGGLGTAGKTGPMENSQMTYFIDSLFRRDGSAAGANSTGGALPAKTSERPMAQDAAEVGRIFMNVSRSQALPPEDVRYVGQLVAQRTGISQQAAEKRVIDVYGRAQAQLNDAEVAAKEAADKARKASAYAALWIFVSLLGGAFVASLTATYGGRQRDA